MVPLPFLSSFVLAWRVCVVFLCSTNSVMNKGKCCVVSVVFTQNCVVPIALKKTLVPKTMASSTPICWQTRNCFLKNQNRTCCCSNAQTWSLLVSHLFWGAIGSQICKDHQPCRGVSGAAFSRDGCPRDRKSRSFGAEISWLIVKIYLLRCIYNIVTQF